jgi:hypothetical protein
VGLLALTVCAAAGAALGRWMRPATVSLEGGGEPNPDVPLAAPPLRLKSMQWDVGAVEPGGRRTRGYQIDNPGPDVWTARPITSSCPCGTARLSKATVGPGESTWLEVNFIAPPKPGQASAHIMVEFATTGPVIQFLVAGEVRASGETHETKKTP